MSEIDPTRRFSNRVADYVKARPGYPSELLAALSRAVGFHSNWVVADVGAGTGISTRLFLENGNEVFAVEPNDAMRSAAQRAFAGNPKFHAVNGTAEQAALADASVHLVVAAQAFHWFDRNAFRHEAVRILKPGGCLALIWNDRQAGGTPFLDGYEQVLHTHAIDYKAVNHRNISEKDLVDFFAPAAMKRIELANAQRFDFDGLCSRLLSSSYAPALEDPRSGPMLTALRKLFDETNQNGIVEMLYTTEISVGQLK